MSKKHFSWLLLATIAVAALVLLFPGKTGRESVIDRAALVPGLADQVNDIHWLRLTGAGGKVIATLQRENLAWVVVEASGYRADWERVKNLLSSLSQAEVIEEKTSKPEYYARLGVEDVSSDDAAGVLIEFAGETGLPAVIIGNSAQGRSGQYARLKDSAKSVLIDSRIDVPRDQIGWLNKNIVDIPEAEVVEYEIIQPDGESMKAKKASADDENFKLQNIPEGREIKPGWNVDAPANSLADLDFQAVMPAMQLDWEGATRCRILTADGLLLEAEVQTVQRGEGEEATEEHWLRLNAEVYAATGTGEEGVTENSDALARAQELDGRVEGWAYQIPAYRSESMTRRMEDLLQPLEDDK
ncbi:DUF4340 domain-containing protein [Pseudomonadota bacterium]